jgi:hypothetical protein
VWFFKLGDRLRAAAGTNGPGSHGGPPGSPAFPVCRPAATRSANFRRSGSHGMAGDLAEDFRPRRPWKGAAEDNRRMRLLRRLRPSPCEKLIT